MTDGLRIMLAYSNNLGKIWYDIIYYFMVLSQRYFIARSYFTDRPPTSDAYCQRPAASQRPLVCSVGYWCSVNSIIKHQVLSDWLAIDVRQKIYDSYGDSSRILRTTCGVGTHYKEGLSEIHVKDRTKSCQHVKNK